MIGADGYELSDRWDEAQLLMRRVRELWRRLEEEEAGPAADSACPRPGSTGRTA